VSVPGAAKSSIRASAAGRRPSLFGPARIYYHLVLGTTLALGLLSLGQGITASAMLRFVVLSAAAAAANIVTVRTGHSHGFHTATVFVVAAALLLPPELLLPLAIVQHVPEWAKERYPWYIQSFNTANHALSAFAAWAAADVLNNHLGSLHPSPRYAVAGVAAALAFVLVNHVVLAVMLRLARGVSFAASGLFALESFTGDFILAGLGVAVAVVWQANAWLVLAVIAPLMLSQRSIRLLGRARDSEERFRTMFDSAPIGIAVRDLDGRVLSTNPAFERMIGYTEEELVGRDHTSLFPPEDAAEARRLHDELVAGGNGYEREERLAAKDGHEVWSRVAVTLVRDAGQRPQFVLKMAQDVTQHKLLEDQLQQAQKMEAIGRLAGGVAHDFNNLLTAISGFANLVLDRLHPADSEIADDVREIDKAAQRAHSLTRQLLAFSRKQLLQPQILSLNDVVGDMDTMLRRLIGENIEIVTSYGSGLSRVKADPGQLQQVIVNLVVNARDEMPDGGKLSIETKNVVVGSDEAPATGGERRAGSFVALTIRDTGRGMDAETKARLFEPFFTRKDVGKGTGLGLAMVYGIVKQSDGFIDVESEPGEGAAFTIFLPAALGQVEAQPSDAPQPEAVSGGTETILLVEDEAMVRRYVATVLQGAGYRVLLADDGNDAIALAQRERIDLLLTDVVMPKIGGPELAERLALPVVFMSGYSGDRIAHSDMLKPGTAFIQKPFTAGDLKRKIRSVLDEREGAKPSKHARPRLVAIDGQQRRSA
jgi:PAS domain S-box-containing protein